jgi:hypothetical protein
MSRKGRITAAKRQRERAVGGPTRLPVTSMPGDGADPDSDSKSPALSRLKSGNWKTEPRSSTAGLAWVQSARNAAA